MLKRNILSDLLRLQNNHLALTHYINGNSDDSGATNGNISNGKNYLWHSCVPNVNRFFSRSQQLVRRKIYDASRRSKLLWLMSNCSN